MTKTGKPVADGENPALDGSNRLAGGREGSVWLSVVTADGRHAVVRPSDEIQLAAIEARPHEPPGVPPDVLRSREWDFREFLGQKFLEWRGGL